MKRFISVLCLYIRVLGLPTQCIECIRGLRERLTTLIRRKDNKYITAAARNGSPNHVSPNFIPHRKVFASNGPAISIPTDCTTAKAVYKTPTWLGRTREVIRLRAVRWSGEPSATATRPIIKMAGAGAENMSSMPIVSRNAVPRDSQRSLLGASSFRRLSSKRERKGRMTRTAARLTAPRTETRMVAWLIR